MNKVVVFGGRSEYRLALYNSLASSLGFDFIICDEAKEDGIKGYADSSLKNHVHTTQKVKLIGNFYYLSGIFSLLKKYDTLIVGGAYCVNFWLYILWSRLTGRRQVFSWSHGMYGREQGVRKWIKIIFFKFCHGNFVYNNRSRDLMIKSGVNADKVFRLGNCLDTPENLEIYQKTNSTEIYRKLFGNDRVPLVFVGRVSREKRIDILLDALLILKKRGRLLNLLIVGKDVNGLRLEEYAEELGLSDQVVFYGPSHDKALLGNLFYNAELCVSPGNVGLTAIHAMSFGCPVISHDDFNFQGPEFEAIKPEKTGLFFKQLDSMDLANQIELWLDTFSERKELRAEIQKNCLEEVMSNWSIESELEVFRNVLSLKEF